jgi:hypothetical protein
MTDAIANRDFVRAREYSIIEERKAREDLRRLHDRYCFGGDDEPSAG